MLTSFDRRVACPQVGMHPLRQFLRRPQHSMHRAAAPPSPSNRREAALGHTRRSVARRRVSRFGRLARAAVGVAHSTETALWLQTRPVYGRRPHEPSPTTVHIRESTDNNGHPEITTTPQSVTTQRRRHTSPHAQATTTMPTPKSLRPLQRHHHVRQRPPAQQRRHTPQSRRHAPLNISATPSHAVRLAIRPPNHNRRTLNHHRHPCHHLHWPPRHPRLRHTIPRPPRPPILRHRPRCAIPNTHPPRPRPGPRSSHHTPNPPRRPRSIHTMARHPLPPPGHKCLPLPRHRLHLRPPLPTHATHLPPRPPTGPPPPHRLHRSPTRCHP